MTTVSPTRRVKISIAKLLLGVSGRSLLLQLSRCRFFFIGFGCSPCAPGLTLQRRSLENIPWLFRPFCFTQRSGRFPPNLAARLSAIRDRGPW
jgi:hypothetical protein